MSPKTVTGVLILSMAAGLAGCGKSWSPQKPPPALPPKQEADVLIGQISAYLDNDAFDNADTAAARLDVLAPSLPPEYAAKIEKAKKDIATAKAKHK